MDLHRLVAPISVKYIPTARPFSSFTYLEEEFEDQPSIHRCFSLARSMGFQTMLVEDIPAVGIIKDENEELPTYVKGFRMGGLKRLSFWKVQIANSGGMKGVSADDLIGYAILKLDICRQPQVKSWHVFEAVFRKYPHPHNCLPKPCYYRVRVDTQEFSLPGVLYCQQNGLNKACAHVALRSLLSRRLPSGDGSYREMNKIAAANTTDPFIPGNGLSVRQIRAILDAHGITYRDIDYEEMEKKNKKIRKTHPFRKYVYAGIESGCGALLGFRLSGPGASDSRHIIPFYGHTFNKDTWAPDADFAYFDVGGGIGYIPSESWTSSFLGHDDNFGPNYCVPRLYAKPKLVDYVAELLPEGFEFDGIAAEAIALQFLYSLYPRLESSRKNPWMRRLTTIAHPDNQRVVLRAIATSRDHYLQTLRSLDDWLGNVENPAILKAFEEALPESLWIVEISSPQLFPANQRKLGEIVMDPRVKYDPQNIVNYDRFLLCRLPGKYFFIRNLTGDQPTFIDLPSALISHTQVLTFPADASTED
jgi:hypothetical protein